MTNWRMKTAIFVTIGVLVLTFSLITAWAMPAGTAFIADQSNDTSVDFDDLHIDVPAGASDQALTVEYGDTDLTGIHLPYGFQMVGRPYRFGPHGLKFNKNKALKARLKIKAEGLPAGFSVNAVRLYYINREQGQLEVVPNQQFNQSGELEANLEHFSDYVIGVQPNWNGDGLQPYLDYVHEGAEHLNLSSLSLSVLLPIYSIKERGFNLSFNIAYNANRDYNKYFDQMYAANGWSWDFPHIGFCTYSTSWPVLYLPGGASYNICVCPPDNVGVVTVTQTLAANEKILCTFNGKTLTKVQLKDGSTFEIQDPWHQTYYDTKGNWVKYMFTSFLVNPAGSGSGALVAVRVTSMEDSSGHKIFFTYNWSSPCGWPTLAKVEQEVLGSGYTNNRKTIFSVDYIGEYANQMEFKDALNRVTTVHNSIHTSDIDWITYPNGARSEYSSDSNARVTHKWYRPDGTVQRTDKYSVIASHGSIITWLQVDDGVRGKYYWFTGDFADTTNRVPVGYTYKEETYEINNGTFGKLKKQVMTDFYTIYGETSNFLIPKTVTTYLTKSDGSIGQASTYQYEYDDWGNTTRIIDPNGTETRMAYANTNSFYNFSTLCYSPVITEGFESSPYSIPAGNWSISSIKALGGSYSLYGKITSSSNSYTTSKTVTISQAGGNVTFKYYRSSNDCNFFFYIDGKIVNPNSGSGNSVTYNLSSGTHTLKWTAGAAIQYPSSCYVCVDDIQVTDYNVFTNPCYQNYLFSSSLSGNANIGYDKLLTKVTFIKASTIKNPVYNTTQLKQTHYKYDAAGNLVQTSEAYNGSYINTYSTYDSYGNCLSQTDGNGNQLFFEYANEPYTNAPSVYLSKVKRADGTVLATYGDFDPALGKPLTVTDPKGNVFTYTFDAIGRQTQEKLNDPTVGITKKLIYDDVNDVVTMSYGNDPNWQVGRFTFDPIFGKLQTIERQKADGSWLLIKQNHFDADGRVDWSQDNMFHKTQHVYDELDREIQTISPTNDSTYYAWNDKTLTITDANNNTQTKYFDLLDRLIKVEEHPNSGVTIPTTYTYDNYFDTQAKEPHSNLIQVVNGRTAATTYTYNNLGLLTRVDYPQDGQNPLAPETYTYDNMGNLRTKTGARGTKTIDYEFFAGYRVSQITEPDGRIISNTYDNNDNLHTQTCPGSVYTYDYDAQNRVTNLTAQLDGNSFSFGYGYDDYGRMTSITYPGRTQPVTYHYDELDRLDYIPDFVSKCFYDADSKLMEMDLANGLKNTYHYDDDDRPDQIKAGNTGDLMNLAYAYDPVGNVKKINGDNYEYDGMNRLTWAGNLPSAQSSVAWSRGTAWSYDAAGNMTGKAVYANGQLQQNTTFSYDLANRLWSMGTTTYGNDTTGARTTKSDGTNSWAYVYDGESRMTRASKNGSVIEDNIYDGSGMRVKKVNNGQTTYYVYSGPNPVMEYSPSDGKTTYYILAGTKSVAEEKDGKKIFYHRDHLGSTRALTDQDRKLVGLCKYDAWGKLESTNEYDEGVVNGDFELPDGNGQALSWVAINDVPVVSDCTYAPVNGINGSAALKVTRQGSSGTAYWSRQHLFVSPDTDYVLTGNFLSGNAQSTGAKAQLVYYDDQGNILKIDDSGALGYSGSWKAFTLNSHAPANAAMMEIRLTEDGSQGTVVFFDGVRLKVPGLAGKYDFTGKKEDEGTGLSYFGARFYDPETGRFTSADSYTYQPNDERGSGNVKRIKRIIADGLAQPIKQNRYIYCLDNPIGHVDADGHMGEEIIRLGQSVEGAGVAGEVMGQVLMGLGFLVTLGEIASHTRARTVGEKWQDFQNNRDKWQEKSKETEPGKKNGTESIERTYENTETGEKLYTHEIVNVETGKAVEKEHPRDYSKAKGNGGGDGNGGAGGNGSGGGGGGGGT